MDQRIHLELVLASRYEDRAALIETLGEAVHISGQHWVVWISRDDAQQVIDRVLRDIGLDCLDDFRILTPTLEDVYLRLSNEPLEISRS